MSARCACHRRPAGGVVGRGATRAVRVLAVAAFFRRDCVLAVVGMVSAQPCSCFCDSVVNALLLARCRARPDVINAERVEQLVGDIDAVR